MSSQPIPFLTPEQYLEIERNADVRSEYIDGRMYAMSGGSRRHAWIAANVLILLGQQLRGKRRGVVGSDLRLFSRQFGIYTYPDIVVTCGSDKYYDDQRDTITDATLVVEVLSPSTQNYDRSQKFEFYRSLPSFAEYLLLRQSEMRAEHHVRQSDGSWLFREFTAATAVLELRSIECRLELGDLYDRVDFSAESLPQ